MKYFFFYNIHIFKGMYILQYNKIFILVYVYIVVDAAVYPDTMFPECV